METEFKKHSVFTARILLGIIFFAAGASKVINPLLFAEIIMNYQIVPDYLVNLTAFFLPYLEITIAIMLISGLFLEGAVIISLILLISFGGSLIFNLARGLNISCGCFTSVAEEATNLDYIYYIARDIVFIFIASYLAREVFFTKISKS
ncbi:MAG: MauE/DoxX family redox-associated membrane protein [Desulforegulaceae bacterium]|nr:MauE/DoxX family redox-associated membrane protein [Desulforegulaceae bacterium]